jgi:hypothetical protein
VAGVVYALSDMERLRTYVGLLENGLPLDEAAFLKCQNLPTTAETVGQETSQAILSPEPEEEVELTTVAQTTGWFNW